MNMNKKNVWMTGLLVLSLSACSSDSTRGGLTDTGGSTSNTGSDMSGSASTSSGSSGTASSTGSPGTSGLNSSGNPSGSDMNSSGNSGVSSMAGSGSGSGNAGAASSASATPQISYGAVQAIDPMTRQDVGVGAVGAAAAGGGIGSPTDKVYRVTVKMDDGSSQMVVVDSMPSYKTGDRVRYSNGSLTQY